MRRSMGRRSNNNVGGGGGGPLMTGHLRDIDLELQLLKRKREMIEQQQQLLIMEQQFKNTSRLSYDQTRYDEPEQFGSNSSFQSYDTGRRNQFGRKRQAENQWQYDGTPKRTHAKTRNQKPAQGSKFSSPKPLMDVKVPKQSIGQKIANQKAPPKKSNRDFTPSKVSKPRAPAGPNKLASHSVTERKSLVATATDSPSEVAVSRMLLPDRPPTQQTSGRLELALGAIMKNIKVLIDNQPKHAPVLRTAQLQRVMKQAVRERIRTVMLGKIVGSLNDILAIYREEFPEETDADILNIALEAGGVSVPKQNLKTIFIDSEDPGDFFRVNMTNLLEQKLNEMFLKLEEIYSNAPSDVATSEKEVDLQKNAVNKDNADNQDKDDNKGKDDNEDNAENKEKDDNKDKADNNDNADNKENDDNTGNVDNKDIDVSKPKEASNKEYKRFLNSDVKVYDVKRIIPKLLKKYLPYVIKLLNVDGMYQTTKAAITMRANEKAAKILAHKEAQGEGITIAPAAQSPTNLPYYVKIMGRPTLPKKKVLQGFLNQYNPKSIKKHRNIHNLLFVGFSDKTDYDVMLGADGAVIGPNMLSIRKSKKDGSQESNEENGENNATSSEVSQEEVKEVEKDCELIPSDLDGQITDLLSSIRKAEEEDNATRENAEADETKKNNDDGAKPEVKNIETDEIKAEVNNIEADEIKAEVNDEEMTENTANDETVNDNVTEENLVDDNAVSQEQVTDEVGIQNSEAANENKEQNTEVVSVKDENSQDSEEQSDDKVGDLKGNATGRSTPSRMSARLANVTPSTIRTRRASRLASQN